MTYAYTFAMDHRPSDMSIGAIFERLIYLFDDAASATWWGITPHVKDRVAMLQAKANSLTFIIHLEGEAPSLPIFPWKPGA